MRSNKQKGLLLSNWKYILLLIIYFFPFYEPLSLRFIVSGPIVQIFELWRFIPSFLIILIYLYSLKSISKNIFFLLIFLVGYIAVSIKDLNITDLVIFVINILALFMLIELGMKKKAIVIIYSIFSLLFFLVVLNFILLLIYPEGVYYTQTGQTYNLMAGYYNIHFDYINFLERDNRLMNFVLPLWFTMLILYIKGYVKFHLAIIIMVIIDMTIILVWSATSVLGVLIMTLSFVSIVVFKSKLIIINRKLIFSLLIITNIALVFLNIQSRFSTLIQDILGKSLTLTGRTDIWEVAKKMIGSSPWVGYGTGEKGYIIPAFSDYFYAHNFILDILIQGGGVLLIVFIFIVYQFTKPSIGECNRITYKVMLITFATWCIMGLVESFFYQYSFWISFAILSNIRYMDMKNKSNR